MKEGDHDQAAENEIRVAAKGQIKGYLGYAFRILNKSDHRDLTIKATGNAIVKALILKLDWHILRVQHKNPLYQNCPALKIISRRKNCPHFKRYNEILLVTLI